MATVCGGSLALFDAGELRESGRENVMWCLAICCRCADRQASGWGSMWSNTRE